MTERSERSGPSIAVIAWLHSHPVATALAAGGLGALLEFLLQEEEGRSLVWTDLMGNAVGIGLLTFWIIGPKEGGHIERFIRGTELPLDQPNVKRRFRIAIGMLMYGLLALWLSLGASAILSQDLKKDLQLALNIALIVTFMLAATGFTILLRWHIKYKRTIP